MTVIAPIVRINERGMAFMTREQVEAKMTDRTAALINNIAILIAITTTSIGVASYAQSAWGLLSLLLVSKWDDWDEWVEEDAGDEGDEEDAITQAPKNKPEERRAALN